MTAREHETRFDEAFLRRLERLAVVAKQITSRQTHGEHRTRRAGSGIDFVDHRDYAPGDDLRRLDWNLYGRLERPLVRTYVEDEDLPLYLLIDTSASMGLGLPSKLSMAQRTAAALAYVALTSLDRVALYPMSDGLGAGLGMVRGKGQIHPLLGTIASFAASGKTNLRAAVSALVERHRRRGVVAILSDFYDPSGHEEALERLRYGRFEPVAVQITAPEETIPMIRGEATLVDAETGEEVMVRITSALAEAYEKRFAARLKGLERFCRERDIPCFGTSADADFEDVVLRVFRSGRLLR